MQILVIKMSSMGDVIHSLPALTDARIAIPTLEIDWVVEPAFADIPSWHPAVKNIIPLPLRQWRKNIFSRKTLSEAKHFYKHLRAKKYDLVIDAQGLLKSAIITKLARGKKVGFDKHSAREGLSSYFYQQSFAVDKNKQAILRTRELFSTALNYPLPNTAPHFSIDPQKLPALDFTLENKYIVFLHGTTWDTKLYPEIYWQELISRCDAANLPVYLPWGNEVERNRAEQLTKNSAFAKVLPRLSISKMATVLQHASAVVTVDTGFGHLSAALEKPTISLYGPTNGARLSITGKNQILLQATFPCSPCNSRECLYAKTHTVDIMPPCFSTIGPDMVWKKLQEIV
jgi:heptosyltransferase-1